MPIKLQNNLLLLDNGLKGISSSKPIITEEQLKEVLKPYKLKETLLELAHLSRRIYIQEFTRPYKMFSNHAIEHPKGILITQFAIEYLVNIFLISGANDYKSKSVRDKDNLLGLFNIYNHSIVHHNLRDNTVPSLLVPLYFEQFRSQHSSKELFTRQWVIYNQIRDKVGNLNFEDINKCIFNKTGLTIQDIIGLSVLLYSHLLKTPLFNIENLIISDDKIKSLSTISTKEKISTFLNLYSATYSEFRDLDKKLNPKPLNEYTKTRFNPLLKKPILRLEDNLFLAPSMTIYNNAIFYGLFWWFDDYYRNESQTKQNEFRIYFGKLFENYVGEILIDLYGRESVKPSIEYGLKGKKIYFTDWTVLMKDKIYLFEVKANQFPFEVLQQGAPDNIGKEVVTKLVKAICQIYQRVQDIPIYPEFAAFANKKIIPIIVFYDIPLVSSSMYDSSIQAALNEYELKFPGIKDFKYFSIGIEELENFYNCSDNAEIEDILQVCKDDITRGFESEVKKRTKTENRENFIDRNFKAFFEEFIPEL